ncbi:MAG: PAS domain-containing sensor histidine kinase [Clostridium sp.]|nr:PAS domain-containing sensor histidine kinase [Clostridium sp.]
MEKINFEKIVENLEEIVVAVDYDNKILYANRAFCSLFNTNCETLKGKIIFDFVPESKDTVVIKDFTYKISKKDDEFCSYFFLSVIDSEIEKVYSDFISTVSHELRTPLTSIRGFADTMLMSYEKLDEGQIKKFLSIIKEQSNRLIKLVENLLSISKIQVQQSNLVYKSVNVKSQVEQAVYVLKNQYPEHPFELKVEDNIPPVLADENKFQQIMINLLDNAAKYSYEKGAVSVVISNSHNKNTENFVSIKVEDHGVGIEPENMTKIFEKFARIENHLTRKTQGSGLGLYIVKSLVEKMGGKIFVQSSTVLPNSGSTFEVLLPAATYTSQSIKAMEDR